MYLPLSKAGLSFVASDVEKALSDLEAPAGYRVELTGEKGDLSESKSEIGMALFIGIIAVYLLLVAQFRSFVHPITVLSSIPLSLSGIAAALFLAGKPVSMPVMVGLILIVGMVINSAILLISFIEQQRERGVSVDEALTTAVDLRFRPIMMTSLSTIVGMIPLAAEWSLGAERFSPLAIAVIGGFTTATFLTIIFIPVLYSAFESGIERLKRITGRAYQNASQPLSEGRHLRPLLFGLVAVLGTNSGLPLFRKRQNPSLTNAPT
jgi:multidrug efflux pump subunit AcrB